MEPILNKQEIEELLAAVRAGRISVDSIDVPGPGPGASRPAEEVDLFQIYSHEGPEGELRIPNLDILLDTFARNFSISLTNQLQRTFMVDRVEINTTTFQESLAALKNQGAIGIYNTDPLKYGFLLHFNNLLSFNLLEIMLGSSISAEPLALDRNLTTIEINVLKNTMDGVCIDLQRSFQPVTSLHASLIKVENNFRLVNIVDADTEVIVTRFAVKVAGQSGEMRLIIPYLTLEPLREKFKEIVTVTNTISTWGNTLAREALETESTVIARSGLLEMTIRQILSLRNGDIIDINYDPTQPLTIVVEDKPKFIAVPGERNGKKAFHVTGLFRTAQETTHGTDRTS